MVLLHADNRQSLIRRAMAGLRTRIARFLGLPEAPPPQRPVAFAPKPGTSAASRAYAQVTPIQQVARRFDPAPNGPRFHAPDLEAISAVYFISNRPPQKMNCLDWLSDHGLHYQRANKLAPNTPIWAAPAEAIALIDVDHLGGIAQIVDQLMKLRLHRPDLTVILLTEEGESHDFSLERLALCDVTLRVPCSYAAFEFAIVEAPINNRVWQERMVEIGQI